MAYLDDFWGPVDSGKYWQKPPSVAHSRSINTTDFDATDTAVTDCNSNSKVRLNDRGSDGCSRTYFGEYCLESDLEMLRRLHGRGESLR